MRYYYCIDQINTRGPLEHDALKQMVISGALPSDALVCKEGGEEWERLSEIDTSKQQTDTSLFSSPPLVVKAPFLGTPVQWGIFAGFILLIIVALGFTHIIFNEKVFAGIVPKQGFTYAMTFVSVEDLINRYNNRSLGSAMRGDPMLEYLVGELERKGIITTKKKTWKEVEDNVRRSLPDK